MPFPLLAVAAEGAADVAVGSAAVEGTAAVVGTEAAATTGEVLTAAQRAEMLRKAAAAAAALAASQAKTCLTCKTPNPKCDELYKEIEELTRDLAQRRGAMLADPLKMYDLFLQDPTAKVPDPRNPGQNLGRWTGHQQQIEQKKKELNDKMDEHKKEGCSGGLPPGAETQAGLDAPTKPFGR